jgi:acyl-CoA thioester hydrolase
VIEAKLRVIYGDTDQMGVVYYANYFRFFEFARGEFFRQKGASYIDFERQGYGMPVIEAHANYRAPARYEDLLIIKLWVDSCRRASVTFKYEVRREGSDDLLTEGHTIHACINKEGRPTKMPQEMLDLLGVKPS